MYVLLLVVQGRCNYRFGALVKNHADFLAPGNPNFGAGLVRLFVTTDKPAGHAATARSVSWQSATPRITSPPKGSD